MKIIDSFQNRLKKAMEINNIKQVDLVQKTNLDKTLINKYLSGVSNPRQSKLNILAEALNVNEIWLMGYDVPMNRKNFDNISNPESKAKESSIIFVYGTIPAGVPLECIEDIIDTEEISSDMLKGDRQYFGLRVKGNSMNPDYLDGDILILEKVEDCESGEDAIVMVNGDEGTFKRIRKTENGITLQPLNPDFEPITFTKEEVENLPVKIIGVVTEIRRKKKRRK